MDRTLDRAARHAGRLLRLVGDEIRTTRLGLGLSQVAVARAAGVSHAQVSRIERAVHRMVPLADLVAVAVVVGLDLSIRVYPGGPPLRDRAHLELLGRFHARLGPGLRWRTEVPLDIGGDQRAWDATVEGRGWTVVVEAETRLHDIQALLRRLNLKCRDAGIDRLVLVVRDSQANRLALRVAAADMSAAFPVPAREILAALGAGRPPEGSGLVML